MKTKLISMLINMVIARLSSQTMKDLADKGLDTLEDYVAKSPNKIDDAVIPLCKTIRIAFDVPDDD